MIQLRLLGSTGLVDRDGRDITSVLTQPKRLALLAYLAVNPGFQRRDTLLAMFWPELDTDRGRDALNQAVRFLRKEFSGETESVIVSRGATELGIVSGDLWCDVHAFRSAISDRRHHDALELYRGDLLVGFFADGTDGFERWLEAERARLRAAATRAAVADADARERDRNPDAAILSARRALELAGLDERVVRDLLERLDRLGDRAGALQSYDAFAKRLAEELGAEPSAETNHLVQQVRTRANNARLAVSPAPVSFAAEPGRPVETRVAARGQGVRQVMTSRPSGTWFRMGIFGTALAAGAAVVVAKEPKAPRPTRVTVELPESSQLVGGHGFSFALSRDGSTIAFLVGTERKIMIRRLDQPAGTLFPNTPLSSDLHFSPDGRWMAYRQAARPSGPTVLKLDGDPALSVPVQRDTTLGWLGITWTRSTDIVYVVDNALWRMAPTGRGPIKVASMDTTVDRRWLQPTVLSDGRTIAMRVTPRGEQTDTNDRLALISIDGGTRTLLDLTSESAIGDFNGTLIYSRAGPVVGQGQIVGVRFDLKQRRVVGSPVLLVDSVDTNTGVGAMAMTSDNGSLAYVLSMPRYVLQIVDSLGATFAEIECPRTCNQPRWSPDGKHITMYVGEAAAPGIAVYDLESGNLRRLHGAFGDFPSWTGDSKRIVFTGKGAGSTNSGQPMWIAADGSSPPERIPGTEAFGSSVLQALISPDGRHVIVRTQNLSTDSQPTLHAFATPLGGHSQPVPLISEAPNPYNLAISPDGKWLAYTAAGGKGRAATFVQPLLGGGSRVRISPGEGFNPRWTANGQKLIYSTDGPGRQVATLDLSGKLPRVRRTTSLFHNRSFARDISSFDAHPTEERFVITKDLGRPPELKLITNFPALVREKLAQRRKE